MNSKNSQNFHPATSPDQPIYRGSSASALGQQLLDIRAVGGAENVPRQEVTAARSRLAKTQNRHIAMEKENRAAGTGGFTVGVPSDGGFIIQSETAIALITNVFNNSEVLSRCDAHTIGPGTQSIKIVGIDEKSRVNGSRSGGIVIYSKQELDELEPSKPVLNLLEIEPKKYTALVHASDEMTRDATFLGFEMRKSVGEELAFKCQDLIINGTGAGEALGIIAAGCTILVAKENGQAARTILTQNISKMWAAFGGKNPVWLINRDINQQLDDLIITVGASGVKQAVVSYADGFMRIKGAPVVEIEQCSTLGTCGDLILADLGQYVVTNKGDVDEAMSIHVNFLYAQDTFRFIYYFDGQPRFASPVTPYKGASGAKVSPFVTLATRA